MSASDDKSIFSSVISFFKNILQQQTLSTSILPKDVWIHVLSFLPLSDIISFGCTCSFLNSITEDENIWKSRLPVPTTLLLPQFKTQKAKYNTILQFSSWNFIKQNIKIVSLNTLLRKEKGIVKLKAVVFGHSRSGKTSMCQMITEPNFFSSGFCNTYTNTPRSTIGVSFFSLKFLSSYFPPHLNFNVHVDIFDTEAGQERFVGNHKQYAKGADVLIFTFDSSFQSQSIDVFAQLDIIISQINNTNNNNNNNNNNKTIPCLLVGTKIDLPRKVPKETALEYAKKHNMAYVEVSAATKQNLELPFLFMAMAGTKQYKQYPQSFTTLLYD